MRNLKIHIFKTFKKLKSFKNVKSKIQILDHSWDQHFTIAEVQIWSSDQIFHISEHDFLLPLSRWASCLWMPEHQWPFVSALGKDASVVVKEEVVEPALVEQLRSSHTNKCWSNPFKRAFFCSKLPIRTSPEEERMIMGKPASHWERILRLLLFSLRSAWKKHARSLL